MNSLFVTGTFISCLFLTCPEPIERKLSMWANDDVIQVRKGVYGLEELILKWNNIQMTRLFQSPYQRQKKLATVKIYTAGGAVVIPYITYRQAIELVNYGLFKIETNSDQL